MPCTDVINLAITKLLVCVSSYLGGWKAVTFVAEQSLESVVDNQPQICPVDSNGSNTTGGDITISKTQNYCEVVLNKLMMLYQFNNKLIRSKLCYPAYRDVGQDLVFSPVLGECVVVVSVCCCECFVVVCVCCV